MQQNSSTLIHEPDPGVPRLKPPTPRERPRRIPSWSGPLLIGACLIFLFTFDYQPVHSHLYKELLNLGHVPLFGVIALAIYAVLRPLNLFARHRGYAAFAFTLILGLMTECGQSLTPGRFFELTDLGRDAVGAGAALLLITRSRHRHLCATLLILPALIPVFSAAADHLHMIRTFPLIASFESQLEPGRWQGKTATLTLADVPTTHGSHSLRIDLSPGLYPGVSARFLPWNWKGYTRLCLDVFVSGTETLPLTVRINDLAHDNTYADRYNRRFALDPGWNHLAIDLDEVQNAPETRPMNLGNISGLAMFSAHLFNPRTIYLDHVRLE